MKGKKQQIKNVTLEFSKKTGYHDKIIHRNQAKVYQNLKKNLASMNNLFGINRKMQFVRNNTETIFFSIN